MPPIPHRDTGVYAIRNTVNGKVYVGSSAKSLKARMRSHRAALIQCRHNNRHLQRAWDKYGGQCFVFSVLERCPPHLCLDREQWWIDTSRCADRGYGYNACPTAGNSLGMRHSPDSILKIRAAKSNISDETRSKISASRVGIRLSDEHRSALKAANTGRIPNEETRRKLSLAARNRSEETRDRLRQAYALRSSEVRQKSAEATAQSNRSRIWTVEMRQKASASVTGLRHSEESRAKMSAARKGRKVSPETRLRMAEAARRRWQKQKGVE